MEPRRRLQAAPAPAAALAGVAPAARSAVGGRQPCRWAGARLARAPVGTVPVSAGRSLTWPPASALRRRHGPTAVHDGLMVFYGGSRRSKAIHGDPRHLRRPACPHGIFMTVPQRTRRQDNNRACSDSPFKPPSCPPTGAGEPHELHESRNLTNPMSHN